MRSLLLVTAALAACGPDCPQIAGSYTATFSSSCSSATITTTLAQSGCEVTISSPGVGTARGSLSGDSLSADIAFASPCAGAGLLQGTLESDGTVEGSFSGQNSCCAITNGLFTMSR